MNTETKTGTRLMIACSIVILITYMATGVIMFFPGLLTTILIGFLLILKNK